MKEATISEQHFATVNERVRTKADLLLGLMAVAGLGAFIWLYWPVLPGLIAQWWNEDDYSHGFLVPLVSLAIVYLKREDLARAPVSSSLYGIPIILASGLTYLVGNVGADLFLQRVSMIGMISGAVIFLAGWAVFRILLFPIAYLLLAIPLPGIVFQSIAFPLQLFAAKIATQALQLFSVPVLREGNIIHLATISLDVEEACSGIRSLLSLTALGVVFAYLTEKKWFWRTLIALSVVPIAIAANVLRVTTTGFIAHYVSPDAAEGFFHGFGGMSIFLIALLLFFGLSSLLQRWKGEENEA